MPGILGLVLVALGSTALPVQERARPAALVDADFEQDDHSAWFVPQPSTDAGFRASRSGDDPFAGESCALLEYTRTGPPRGFGNLIQSISAEDLRGKRVRLRAAVRTEGKGRAQLWLREDGEQGFSVLFDNMSDRPILSGEWATYDIVGDVDSRATVLVVGMMLFEGGKAFLDEVSVDVLGETSALLTAPRALVGRGLANLVAFTRLLGYVRHFHPSDQAETRDWGAIALAGASMVEDAPDDAELARRLQDFFAPVAPTVQVFESSSPPAPHPALAPPPDDKAKLTRWRNVGFGQDEPGRSVYYRRRDTERLKDGEPSEGWTLPAAAYEAEIAPGVTARVPTVLWRDAEGTLPHGEAGAGSFALPDSYLATGDDRGTRLAAVMLAWNVFQHFYLYFDVTEVDWRRELERALSAAATDADQREFLRTLRRMVAALHDGHGYVSHMLEAGKAPPSVCWDWVEDELVILAPCADGKLAPGDVVTTIGGVDTQRVFEDVAGFLSAATPQFLRHKALYELGSGGVGTNLSLGLRSPDGTVRTVEVSRGRPVEEPRPAKIAELEPSIWYVDLGRIRQADFDGAIESLADAKGIVFDLRGYPSIWTDPLAHLVDEPIECAQWLVPVALLPDRKATTFQKSSWSVKPEEPRFTAKVAFLTDGRAVSAAETYMGLVEHHRLAPIVGEPTAGTNGNVNPFVLPGRYSVSWTGMKVLKQDGSRHHGVGIQPTVPCSRTIAGVAAGRDEQLERALAIVRG